MSASCPNHAISIEATKASPASTAAALSCMLPCARSSAVLCLTVLFGVAVLIVHVLA
ncbi:hypothetical protein [Novosphingobium humi]|uniref:hypothetical protein n=1 Tax=Novosphingobium humi TaxID=2282397 RepID=UPI0025B24A49|nr:hypothetical protein [Novosphingobium humi]WJS98107.1 hypothetical protein NYQ05_13355 [Novosphingobium humi]